MNIKDFKKLKRQAAGHEGPLTDPNEMLLFKPSTKQEIKFYEHLATRHAIDNTDDISLQDWTPTFLGILQENKEQNKDFDQERVIERLNACSPTSLTSKSQTDGNVYLVMENLLHGYVRPNVLDIKLGHVLWDDAASEEKRIRLDEVSKTSTSGTLGFRICGMNILKNTNVQELHSKYYEPEDDGYIFVNKYYGRELTASNVTDAFDLYFGDNNLSLQNRNDLIHMFSKRLQLFYNTLLNEEVRMISSSLLFIYECDTTRWINFSQEQELIPSHVSYDSDEEGSIKDGQSKESISGKTELSRMSIIDFAHTKFTPGLGIDDNVLDGVESLIDIFERLKTKYTI